MNRNRSTIGDCAVAAAAETAAITMAAKTAKQSSNCTTTDTPLRIPRYPHITLDSVDILRHSAASPRSHVAAGPTSTTNGCREHRPEPDPAGVPAELGIPFAPPIRAECRLIRVLTGEPLVWVRLSSHRAFEQPVERRPTVAGSTAVEAEGELVEVVVELTVAQRALLGADRAARRAPTRRPRGPPDWAAVTNTPIYAAQAHYEAGGDRRPGRARRRTVESDLFRAMRRLDISDRRELRQ